MSSPTPLAASAHRPLVQTSTAFAPALTTGAGPSDPNQRLIIQDSERPGVFVYTLIDRSTGQVLTQLACDTVLDPLEAEGGDDPLVSATA
jgi:hypothetical protein